MTDEGPDWCNEVGVRLKVQSMSKRWSHTPLAVLALRRNPRRPQLLVSTVLGKHLPVAGVRALAAARALAGQVALTLGGMPLESRLSHAVSTSSSSSIVVVGMAETATGLAGGVARFLPGAGLVTSTRDMRDNARVAFSFDEPHSHGRTHHVLADAMRVLDTARTVVLVDDEISTGTTMANLVNEIRGRTGCDHIIAATLIDGRPNGEPPWDVSVGRTTARLARAKVHTSMGASHWVADHDHLLSRASHATGADAQWQDLEVKGPALLQSRLGVAQSQAPQWSDLFQSITNAAVTHQWGRTLVLGVEEFMDLPIATAAQLKADVQSTTRSPIAIWDRPRYPLRSGWQFPSWYDVDIPAFVYRPASPDASPTYDDVLVMVPGTPSNPAALRGLAEAAGFLGRRVWVAHIGQEPPAQVVK